MVRDHRGNFVESHGVATESHELKIADAEQLAPSARMDLQRNGFELVDAPVTSYDYLDHEQITGHYYRDCEALVAERPAAGSGPSTTTYVQRVGMPISAKKKAARICKHPRTLSTATTLFVPRRSDCYSSLKALP